MAVPVPVLEELGDRAGGVLVEADPARDVGAPLAAHALELVDPTAAHRDHRAQVARSLAQRRAGGDVAPQVAQRRAGAVGVDQAALALDLLVVVAEGRRDVRRGRGAARILEQHGVEERGALRGLEADRVGQALADEAAALGVAHRLTAGDVQGV
jgi:hypothetical protein